MRKFDDTDRKKKKKRIQLPDNPGNLSTVELVKVEAGVRSILRDGYAPCPAAWKLADDLSVSRLDVGVIIDKLGIRVTDCQLGCFKVSKTSDTGAGAAVSAKVARGVDSLGAKEAFTCDELHELAGRIKVLPMRVAEAVNARGLKIKQCQLGCF